MSENRLPRGVNVPDSPGSPNIHQFVVGDTMAWRERLFVGNTPVTPSAFEIGFALVSQRFSPDVVFSAGWGNELAHKAEDPGLVEVELPKEISDSLRRGSYMYAITATNLDTEVVATVKSGYLLVEYKPTSPHKDIPYN